MADMQTIRHLISAIAMFGALAGPLAPTAFATEVQTSDRSQVQASATVLKATTVDFSEVVNQRIAAKSDTSQNKKPQSFTILRTSQAIDGKKRNTTNVDFH